MEVKLVKEFYLSSRLKEEEEDRHHHHRLVQIIIFFSVHLSYTISYLNFN